jgi:hypothetical protein
LDRWPKTNLQTKQNKISCVSIRGKKDRESVKKRERERERVRMRERETERECVCVRGV